MASKSIQYREVSGTILDLPVYPTKIMVPVSALLLLLQGIVKLINDLITVVTGREPEALEEKGVFARAKK